MSVARQHDDGLDAVTADFIFNDLVTSLLAHLDQAVAGNHDELLPFRVVPMLAFRDARLGNVDAYLTAIQRVYQLGKRPARIHVHLQIENRLFFRQVAEECGHQAITQTVLRHFESRRRSFRRIRHGTYCTCAFIYGINDFSKRGLVSDRTIAITSFSRWQYVKSLEFAMMFLTFERADHLLDQIVNVEDLHLYASVIDLDWEVIGDIVAERGDG